MPRGPRVTKPVRDLIVGVFDALLQKNGDPPSGPTVHALVSEELVKRGWPDPIPSLRAVQQILGGPRQRARALAEVDRAWTLAAFNSHEGQVTDDAAGVLLELWTYAVVRSYPFTVRHARWATRLRWVRRAGGSTEHPGQIQSLSSLYYWSARYAGRERMGELADQPMETVDLDAALGLNAEVYATAASIGLVPRLTLGTGSVELSETGPGLIPAHLEVADAWSPDRAKLREFVDALLDATPASRRHGASELYELWLVRLREVSRLDQLPDDEWIGIVAELAEQVCDAAVNEHWGPWFDETTAIPIFHWDKSDSVLVGWRPSDELLKRVGIPDDEYTKEG